MARTFTPKLNHLVLYTPAGSVRAVAARVTQASPLNIKVLSSGATFAGVTLDTCPRARPLVAARAKRPF
jgi:hypothetical protein